VRFAARDLALYRLTGGKNLWFLRLCDDSQQTNKEQ
jgi:hypothetical protein